MMNPTDELSREVAKVKLRADYPQLIESDNSLVTAAKNIRTELKAAFPGVKFSVKTSRYSGGDSIDVAWIDGPTTRQVDAIIGKYQAGKFDGMTDSYTYDNKVFNNLFGDASYVFSRRDLTDATVSQAIAIVASKFGAEPLTVEDYRKGRAYYWATESGYNLDRELNLTLSAMTTFNQEAAAA